MLNTHTHARTTHARTRARAHTHTHTCTSPSSPLSLCPSLCLTCRHTLSLPTHHLYHFVTGKLALTTIHLTDVHADSHFSCQQQQYSTPASIKRHMYTSKRPLADTLSTGSISSSSKAPGARCPDFSDITQGADIVRLQKLQCRYLCSQMWSLLSGLP